jgi:hypothetical protein
LGSGLSNVLIRPSPTSRGANRAALCGPVDLTHLPRAAVLLVPDQARTPNDDCGSYVLERGSDARIAAKSQKIVLSPTICRTMAVKCVLVAEKPPASHD